jgi:hypothetical protein
MHCRMRGMRACRATALYCLTCSSLYMSPRFCHRRSLCPRSLTRFATTRQKPLVL